MEVAVATEVGSDVEVDSAVAVAVATAAIG